MIVEILRNSEVLFFNTLILFQADSGWGKSSVVLASVARLQDTGHFAVAIDSRSASSSQFILRVISYVLSKFEDLTLGVAGFYSPDDDATASHTDTSQGPRQLRDSAQAVPVCAYWYDHGGTHQHGDAFELYCLVCGRSKSEVLRDLRAEWIAHRRGSDDQAASLSQPQTGIEEDATRGGALSASQEPAVVVPLNPASLSANDSCASGPYPPPARPSYCCGSLVWIWNEPAKRYRCGSCKQ